MTKLQDLKYNWNVIEPIILNHPTVMLLKNIGTYIKSSASSRATHYATTTLSFDRELEPAAPAPPLELPLHHYIIIILRRASLSYVRASSSREVRMLFELFLFATVCLSVGHGASVIYTAPSAVSHQSRIDIRHSPLHSFVYSPATVFAHPARTIITNDHHIITPVISTNHVLTPVAYSYYHDLPLARAMKDPVSLLQKLQEEGFRDFVRSAEENKAGSGGASSTEAVKIEQSNIASLAADENKKQPVNLDQKGS